MAVTIRRADIEDALHVAALVDIAGHGIDLDLWLARRDGDNSLLSAVRRMVREDRSQPYHYSRAHLIEVDGQIAGAIIGGPVDTDAAGTPRPHIDPLIALETRAANHWSVLAIAVYPEFRGQGMAGLLLDHAFLLARQEKASGVSIVVEDSNAKAIALYKNKGFIETETQPFVPYEGRSGPQNWVMLTRSL